MSREFNPDDVNSIAQQIQAMQSPVILFEIGSETPHELHLPGPLTNETATRQAIAGFCASCAQERHNIAMVLTSEQQIRV